MIIMTSITLTPVGVVRSPLVDRKGAPRQPDEGAPAATIHFDPTFRDALHGMRVGGRVIVLTWLDRAARDVQRVHPRGRTDRPALGVFATRSPDRPNPIGLHEVEVTAVRDLQVDILQLEALDGTPVLDVKAVLPPDPGDR
jgi:tRNA-Thr(GGU) m(6)t(6)A37 methyltransferase TsaA